MTGFCGPLLAKEPFPFAKQILREVAAPRPDGVRYAHYQGYIVRRQRWIRSPHGGGPCLACPPPLRQAHCIKKADARLPIVAISPDGVHHHALYSSYQVTGRLLWSASNIFAP